VRVRSSEILLRAVPVHQEIEVRGVAGGRVPLVPARRHVLAGGAARIVVHVLADERGRVSLLVQAGGDRLALVAGAIEDTEAAVGLAVGLDTGVVREA